MAPRISPNSPGVHFPNSGGHPFFPCVLYAPHGGPASPPPSTAVEVTFPPSLPPALGSSRIPLTRLLACLVATPSLGPAGATVGKSPPQRSTVGGRGYSMGRVKNNVKKGTPPGLGKWRPLGS